MHSDFPTSPSNQSPHPVRANESPSNTTLNPTATHATKTIEHSTPRTPNESIESREGREQTCLWKSPQIGVEINRFGDYLEMVRGKARVPRVAAEGGRSRVARGKGDSWGQERERWEVVRIWTLFVLGKIDRVPRRASPPPAGAVAAPPPRAPPSCVTGEDERAPPTHSGPFFVLEKLRKGKCGIACLWTGWAGPGRADLLTQVLFWVNFKKYKYLYHISQNYRFINLFHKTTGTLHNISQNYRFKTCFTRLQI